MKAYLAVNNSDEPISGAGKRWAGHHFPYLGRDGVPICLLEGENVFGEYEHVLLHRGMVAMHWSSSSLYVGLEDGTAMLLPYRLTPWPPVHIPNEERLDQLRPALLDLAKVAQDEELSEDDKAILREVAIPLQRVVQILTA